MKLRFVAAMARRELRAAWRRFLLYGLCMAIGIAAVVGLHALRATVRHGIDEQSRSLLGSDLLLESRAPFDEGAASPIAALERLATAPVAHITRFGSMALAPASGRTRMVDVQAVEGPFPFYGEVRTAPAGAWQALTEAPSHPASPPRHGGSAGAREPVALVDPSLLIQLDVDIGDTIELGAGRFRLVAKVLRAPGNFGVGTQIAPRVFIAQRDVEATGLVTHGSLVEHRLHVKAPEAVLSAWLAANRPELEASGVRAQTLHDYQEGLNRSFASLTRYLGLVGLAALALGSIGVAAGVRVFVREKLAAVALLRSLGARPVEVVAVYGALALALGAAAGLLGVAIGVAMQFVFPHLSGGVLPVDVALRLEPTTVATGLVLGLWATAVCALGPLFDLAAVAPLRALRRDFGRESHARKRRGRRAVIAAAALSVLGASLWQAPGLRTGLSFALGLALSIGLLAASAALLARLLRTHPLRRAPWWLRQGVANLFRPRNHTLATVVAVGFALFLVATLHSVQHNVLEQIEVDRSGALPNLVFFDVLPDQQSAFDAFLDARGVEVFERAPIVSARIAAVRGVPSARLLAGADPDRELRWALRREYQVTWARSLRESEVVVQGHWWAAGDAPEANSPGAATAGSGPVPVSLEDGLAERLGVGIGDRLSWEIQGVPLEAEVASLRDVDWGRLGTNFFAVFPPWALAGAPQRQVVIARLEGERARAEVLRDLVGRFPNVSALDASTILRALDVMMQRMGAAVRVLAAFTLATGLAILLASAAAARHERTREGLLLRTLGASARTVRRIAASEAVALAALAVLVGSLLALVASWALVRLLFDLPFAPPWTQMAALALATFVVTAGLGAASAQAARSGASPFAALREAERAGLGG